MSNSTESVPTLRAALSYIESLDGGVPDKVQIHINEGTSSKPYVDVSFFVYEEPGEEITQLIKATGVHPRAYVSDSLAARVERDAVTIEVAMHFMDNREDEPIVKPLPYERYLA